MSSSSQDTTCVAAAASPAVADVNASNAQSTNTTATTATTTSTTVGTSKRADEGAKESAPKRLRTNNDTTVATEEEKKTEEGMDLCDQLGLKAGDRLEVEWQLSLDPESEEDEEEEEDSSASGNNKTITKWWGCTLLPHDGRYEDGVAVRTLEYDPYLPHYPEKTTDDVVFLSHEIVIHPTTHAEFRFRPEGVVQFNSEEEAREAINGILMETLNKHSSKWAQLDRDQQGLIAAGIAKKKELLVEAIMSHTKSPIISADDMKEILQGVMQK